VLTRRRQVAGQCRVAGRERDRPRFLTGSVDADVEPPRGQRITEPVGPFDERDPGRLAVVDQPAGEGVRGIGEAVEIEVEQRQPAHVLGHEDERRRGDRVRDAQPRPERLGEMRLAGAEVTPQAQDVPGPGDRRERATERGRRVRVGADEAAFELGRGGHVRRA
jgi:hypothetical protein